MGVSLSVRLIFLATLLVGVAAAAAGQFALAESWESPRYARVAQAAGGIRGFPAEVVTVKTSDGLTLKGLYWPKRDAAKPIIVFFSGWQPPLESVLAQVTPAVRSGYGVLAVIRRGFSGNPGSASEQGYYEDGQSYTKLARSLAKGGPVILFGYSMGAPVALEVARREPVTGVIVIGLFTHTEAIGLPLTSLMIGDSFDSRETIAEVDEPTVFIYGRDDSIVPVKQGRELFQRATAPRALLVIGDGGHFLRATDLLPIVNAAVDAIVAGDLSQLNGLASEGIEVSIAGPAGTGAGGAGPSSGERGSIPEAESQYSLPGPSGPSRPARAPSADRR